MSEAPGIEFTGNEEELEKILLEFARRIGGWSARVPKRGEWVVAGGAKLSANPNTLDWRIRIVRGDGILLFRTEAFRLPWTRTKAGRIAAFRQGQLQDYIEMRLRGGSPDKFDVGRLREPFSPFGRGVAALTASFSWITASGLAALTLCFLACLAPSFLILGTSIEAIAGRADAMRAAGDGMPALPSSSELSSDTSGFQVGGAILFALPLAFFFGLVHIAALVLTEVWRPLARAGLLSFLFQGILLSWALFPLMPLLAIPFGLLVPFFAHAGYTFVWARRRERVREDAPPRRAALVAGVVLATMMVAAFVPPAATGPEFTDRLALFRDRYMLGNGPGRGAAKFYYAFTLYAADPLKQFYATDPDVPVRIQRTAVVDVEGDPKKAVLAGEGFRCRVSRETAVTIADPGTFDHDFPGQDVLWIGDRLIADGAAVELPANAGREATRDALDRIARDTFPAHALRDVHALAWKAIYYAGPVFCLLVFVGICCPWISIIYRTMAFRSATIALAACVLATGAVMAWDIADKRGAFEMVARMDAEPRPPLIEEGLRHETLIARHHAAFLAFRHPHPDLADALIEAADHEDIRVRLWAVAALGKTRDPRALEVLLRRLKDDSLFVRYRAAEGLGHLGRTEAVGPLMEMMRKGWWYEGLYALEALRRIDPARF